MTLTPYEHQAPAVAQPVQQQRTFADSPLVQWAYEAQQANQIAESLANSSFVPQSMRGRPQDVAAAILAGAELGLPVMAALRSMDVIQGVPALRANAMRGLVQSHGHDLELVESTADKCVMRGRRKGSDTWQAVTWTIARAAQLKLTEKPEWKKQPTTMLVARATSELCRLVAADVLFAAPHAAEELDREAADVVQTHSVTRVTGADLRRDQPQTPAAPVSPPAAQQPERARGSADDHISAAKAAADVQALSTALRSAQADGFAANLGDQDDPVAAAFVVRRRELTAPAPQAAPAPAADAEALWGQLTDVTGSRANAEAAYSDRFHSLPNRAEPDQLAQLLADMTAGSRTANPETESAPF